MFEQRNGSRAKIQLEMEPEPQPKPKYNGTSVSDTARSSVTTPLYTEKISGISDEDLARFHIPRIEHQKVEHSLTRKITRRKCKKEAELQEINHGIDFSKLKHSMEQ